MIWKENKHLQVVITLQLNINHCWHVSWHCQPQISPQTCIWQILWTTSLLSEKYHSTYVIVGMIFGIKICIYLENFKKMADYLAPGGHILLFWYNFDTLIMQILQILQIDQLLWPTPGDPVFYGLAYPPHQDQFKLWYQASNFAKSPWVRQYLMRWCMSQLNTVRTAKCISK